MGFCLGGKFAYISAVRHNIDAAVGYYGVQINEHLDEADALKCALLLHFAEIHTSRKIPSLLSAHVSRAGTRSIFTSIQVRSTASTGMDTTPNAEQAATARERTLAHFAKHQR